MKKIMLLIAALASSHMAYAGHGTGKIELLLAHPGVNNQGVIMFKTENNFNKAACSTVEEGRQWALSLATEHGRAMYSLLLSAQAQDLDVTVIGANDCAAWGDRERPEYIHIGS